jgi:hypothetical protein
MALQSLSPRKRRARKQVRRQKEKGKVWISLNRKARAVGRLISRIRAKIINENP